MNSFNFFAEHPLRQYANLQNASWDEIKKVQDNLLVSHLEYTCTNSPYYKEFYRAYEVRYQEISGVSGIHELPFTEKNEMIAQNFNFRAAPDKEICDISFTSAVTGKTPSMIMLTNSDLARLAYSSECAFKTAGVTAQDTILLCSMLEKCYLGGLGSYLGGVKTGARMVRAGIQEPSYIWNMIQSISPSVIVAPPSLMLKVAEFAASIGKDPSYAGIKKIIAVTEATRDSNLDPLPLTEKLEKLWESLILSKYFSSELGAACCECQFKQGAHINPELVVMEILDDKGRPVREGEAGELVITPLGVKGTPLIRFRTGDISFIKTEKCFCGRTSPRLGPILGRKKQMISINGVKLFPNTILSMLEGTDHFYGGYIEVKRSFDGTDVVTLFAALHNDDAGAGKLKDEIEARLNTAPNIVIVAKEEIDKHMLSGRNKRTHTSFFDLR